MAAVLLKFSWLSAALLTRPIIDLLSTKYLNICFQLLFKAGVQALQAELALQNARKL